MAAGDTAAHAVDAVFDHFTLTPDTGDDGVRAPGDEFDGDALDGCRWNAVVRYDSSKVAVTDGQLRIETQPGDINGDTNQSPRNFVLQDLPDGDWTIQTRLTPTMLHRWQLAGFLVYADDDNYVKFDVVATNTSGAPTDLRAELVSERNGQFGNGGNRSIDVAEATESGWYDLRLKRTGNTYSAEISDGGVTWTSLGDPVTNDAPMTSFGLMALGPEQVSPVTVAFDYFRVVDTVAPSVSVAVDPAAPNGDNGWYVSPVTVSATGTDDRGPVRISYRIGDGEWTDYREPVRVTGDGTRELRFRAVDEAGNVSTESVVSLRVDATAPVVSFGGVTDGGSYELGERLPITASAKDPASGVASVVVTLDGTPVSGPVAPTAGAHRVTAVATDKAGNVTESAASFEVVATYANTVALVDRYQEEGLVPQHRAAAMKSQLKVAERLVKAGQEPQAEAALDRYASFADAVADQSARTQLIAAGEYLRAHL
jgi:hypothetical protein